MLDGFWGRPRRRNVIRGAAERAKRIAIEEGLDARATAELMRVASEVFAERHPDPEQRLRDLAGTARAFGHRFAGFSKLSGRRPLRSPRRVVRARPRRVARALRRTRRVQRVRGADPDPEPEPLRTSATGATTTAGGRT